MVEKLVDLTTSAGTDHTAGTSTRVTTNDHERHLQVVATRTATGAGTVTNAGLFDAASGRQPASSRATSPDRLASGDSIQFTIKAIFDN
jgi:hypothetical protein